MSRILLVMGLTCALCACGSSDHDGAASQSDVTTSSVATRKLIIQTLPAMRPAFDPDIHDYVVDCVSQSVSQGLRQSVQFAASLPDYDAFELLVPTGSSTSSRNFPLSYVQQSVALAPGERIRFLYGTDETEYSIRCLPKDFPPITATLSSGATPLAQWYVYAPDLEEQGAGIGTYVVVSDANGTPVWWMDEPIGSAVDAKLLGSDRIAWTTTTSGTYVVRGFDGKVLQTIGSGLDDHELQPTAAGTYLVIKDVPRICPPDCADMSPWGGDAQTAVIDAEILELDANNTVVWSWRTRDHIALAETGNSGWFPSVGTDIIHMNAIEPDGDGALIFSARHLNAIYHITKSTGAIDWKIGGTARAESLTVVGDTRPTAIGPSGQPLSGQHDVRLWSDGTVSVHDNGTIANRPPFVMRYQLDSAARTAQVVEALQDARVTASGFTGSARRLPSGHWLVQWGDAPFLTELDSEGNPVLTIEYNLGTGFSYRAVPVLDGVVAATALREGMDAMVAD